MIGSVVGSIFGLPILCCCCFFFVKHLKYIFTGKNIRTNWIFVNVAPRRNIDKTENAYIFQLGTWVSRYHQYHEWHKQDYLLLSFDSLKLKVEGKGHDNVGTYTVSGIYSTETQRIGLIKTYQQGTGNPLENLGHSVVIQLLWNSKESQFEGIWSFKHRNIMERIILNLDAKD
ncbi:hypothetical protein I4U23_016221 [Adineta vaga]|nr:hypothetical protein I4U23_016221 [Adineta vaga]